MVNSLPIVERELRVRARFKGTHRMRWIAAAGVIAIWLFLTFVNGHTTPHERAKTVFIAISVVALGFVMLAGVFQTADCQSEERREGTLGLLFLTDLRGYDVVFGKLVSTSLHSFYGLLAIIPVLALPLLMGGMTAGEFWRVTLVLVVTLYLSLTVGMLVSAISRDSRVAMVGAFLIMLLFAGVTPVLWYVAVLLKKTLGLGFLMWVCPVHAFKCAFDGYYSWSKGAGEFWNCILMMIGIGTACIAMASMILPRVWQESGERMEGKKCVGQGRGAEGRLLGRNPFLWLVLRDRKLTKITFWVFLVLLPIWIFFYAGMWSNNRTSQGIGFSVTMIMSFGLHQVLKCLMAADASRRLSEDKQSGALELLLVTPLPTRSIVRGQAAGTWRGFRWFFVVLTMVNLAMVWFVTKSNMMRNDDDAVITFIMMMAGGVVLLYLDGFALTRVGAWMGLTQKRHARAFMATIARVLAPSWLAVVFCVFLGMIGAINGGKGIVETMLMFWFLFAVAVDVLFLSKAQTGLLLDFREVASLGQLESKLQTSR